MDSGNSDRCWGFKGLPWQTLMLGNIEGKRRGWQRMRWLDSVTDSMDMNLSFAGREWSLECCSLWVAKSQTWFSSWATTTPWQSSGWESIFPMQGARVRFLVRELRSYMLHSAAGKKKKKSKRCQEFKKYLGDRINRSWFKGLCVL